MSEVTITVRGDHEERVTPERATVRVGIRAEGAERTVVIDRALRLAEPIRTSITQRATGGSVVDWTSTRLTVRAERPWNNEGKRLALVHYANIDFTATFADASELSLWVTDVSSWDGVEVGAVDWQLTPETAARIEREVAAAAVGVAVGRAHAYANALGLIEVTPVEIADVGLISTGQPSPPASMMKARGAAAFMADSTPGMEYEPDTIIVSSTVEARFVAR